MNKRKFIALSAFAVLFVSVFFTSCYPGDDVSYADLDLVSTAYDQDLDYDQLKTYYLYDSVVHIKDTLDEDANEDLSRDFDEQILGLVKSNMDAYGYTLETDPENNQPDVALTVSAMATENTYVYSYYPYYYWGWGWGWYYKNTDYYGGWGWYYPPYWGGTYIASYTVGTLIINMHDVRNATAETDSVPTIWIGDINGLLGASAASTQQRLEYNINQAFTQSPYLKVD